MSLVVRVNQLERLVREVRQKCEKVVEEGKGRWENLGEAMFNRGRERTAIEILEMLGEEQRR